MGILRRFQPHGLVWLSLLILNVHLCSVSKQPNESFPICVGILAFEGVETLGQRLTSYRELFASVEQRIILFQQLNSETRKAWAMSVVNQFPQLRSIHEEYNIGQRAGFLRLVKSCEQPYVLILEEDFRVAHRAEVSKQLKLAIELLSESVDAVRLRSRLDPGEPNHAHLTWLRNGGRLGSGLEQTHLIEHVVWDSSAESRIRQLRVCRKEPKTWCTSSKYACYTNNPVLYRTDFFDALISVVPDDKDVHFENFLTEFWASQNYTVAYSDGIFTHDRLDRTRISSTVKVQK